MANTYQEIIKKVYYLLAVDEDSTTYDKATKVKPKINSIIKDICKGRYKSVLDNTIIKGGDLPFLQKQAWFETKRSTALTNGAIVWANTLDALTVNLTPSGYLLIGGDVVNYTSTTSNVIGWVTWLSSNVSRWDIIEQIRPVPPDADRSFQLFEIGRYGETCPVPYNESLHWLAGTPNRAWDGSPQWWATINDGDGNMFILIRSGKNAKYQLWYYKKVSDLVNDADICKLPDDSGIEFVAEIVAGELLRETEEDPHGSKLLKLWYNKLHMFYQDNLDFNKKYRNKVKVWNKTSYNYLNTYI
jgi:hypothetical protein